MKTNILRTSCITAGLLVPISLAVSGANAPSLIGDASQRQGHLSGLMAKITLPDGATRMVKLEGVGCAVSICSRTVIKGRTEGDSLVRTWLDSLAAIKDTTVDAAVFVMKDGTEQRRSLVTDFRVLYLANRLGGTEKLDLAKIKSIEFFAPER
jgi:hypothetical protein